MKHTHVLLLIVMLMTALLFSSCDESENKSLTDISTVYKIEEVELPENFSPDTRTLRISGKNITLSGWSMYDPNTPDVPQTYMSVEIDTETGTSAVTSSDNKTDSDGWRILSTTYSDSGEKFVTHAKVGEDCYESIVITQYSSADKELKSYDCGELFDLNLKYFKPDFSGSGAFVVQAIFAQDDYLYIVSNTGAVRISNDGTHSLVESRNEISTAAFTDSGILIFTNNNSQPAYADFETGKLNSVNISDNNSFGSFKPFPIDGYEFGAVLNSFGIYGYKKNEAGEFDEIILCDFNKSDISGFVFNAVSVSPQEYYIISNAYPNYRLLRLTMIKPEDIVEKIPITVAMFGVIGSNAQAAISDFNLQNDKYHLDILLYNDDDEYSGISGLGCEKQFQNDVLSGKIPDIILTGDLIRHSTIVQYANKGLFCDLYSLVEDAGWDKSQLLECITESFESRNPKTGKPELLYLPLTSRIETLYGKASNFSEKLTLDKTLDLLDSLDMKHRLIDFIDPYVFLEHTLEEFINYDTGETNFDTPLFRRYCEIYKRHMKGEFDRDNIEVNGTDAYAEFREGVNILYRANLINYGKHIKFLINAGNDEIVQVGYPDRDGSGVVLQPKSIFAISEKCQYKDVAFDFLKFYATERYFGISDNDPTNIPLITTEMFDNYFENVPKYLYFTQSFYVLHKEPCDDEKAKKDFGEDYRSFYADDEFIKNYRELILSARAEPPMNATIMAIIHSELSDYSKRDDLSIDDVIKYIDNRVSTYYNEQMR